MDLRPNRGRTATEPTEPAPAMVDFSGPAGVELFRLYGDYAPMEHSLIVEMTWADERDNGTETYEDTHKRLGHRYLLPHGSLSDKRSCTVGK